MIKLKKEQERVITALNVITYQEAVYKLDPVSETILEEFYSVAEAARQCNLERANIAKVCQNYDTKVYDTKYQTCGGFKWKFKK